MKKRPIGKTKLSSSVLAMGTMTFGEQNSKKEAFELLDITFERGINFYDVAEMYPSPPREQTYGRSEKILGEWINARKCRDEIIVASKVTGYGNLSYIRDSLGEGTTRLDRKSIVEACDTSLKRMNIDCIDIYQLHWPDRNANFFGMLTYPTKRRPGSEVPLEESFDALHQLQTAGKIRHIGLSNETPWGVMTAVRIAKEMGMPPVATIQNPFGLLNNSFEVGLSEVCLREHVGLIAYSCLGGGVLTGKYDNGMRPEGSRLAEFPKQYQRYTNERSTQAFHELNAVARKHSLDPAAAAIAWALRKPFLTNVIIGATKAEQLKDDIRAANLELPEEYINEVEEIIAMNPFPAP